MAYSLKLLLIALVTLPVSLTVILCSPFSAHGKFGYPVSRIWAWAILKIGGVKLKVDGLGRLDPARPYIFIANHQSNIDIPILVESLPGFQLRWIAKRELMLIPFFGWAMWASGHIVVNRSDRAAAMASLRKARERVRGGISVVIFPEGTRGTGGELLPFKRGGFLLASKTDAPIVPVTIRGSGRLLPKGDWRVRSGQVEVIVSEPIVLDRHKAGALNAVVDRVRGIIEANSRRDAGAAATEKNAFASGREAGARSKGQDSRRGQDGSGGQNSNGIA